MEWQEQRSQRIKTCLVGTTLVFLLAMMIVSVGLGVTAWYNLQQPPPNVVPLPPS